MLHLLISSRSSSASACFSFGSGRQSHFCSLLVTHSTFSCESRGGRIFGIPRFSLTLFFLSYRYGHALLAGVSYVGRSNQALERTAARAYSRFQMTKTLSDTATLAL